MAIHKELPIYRTAFDLTSLAVDLIKNMPRDLKSAIGNRLRDNCLDVVLLIARANASFDKQPHLALLIERTNELEFLLRLCVDKRFISLKAYAQAIELTASIGKQATGWRKSSRLSSHRQGDGIGANDLVAPLASATETRIGDDAGTSPGLIPRNFSADRREPSTERCD